MQQEIEAKFLNQDHGLIRRKLKALGATRQHKMTLIRRTVFDYPDRRLLAKRAWVRLREELDGSVELMLKQVANDTLGQTYEQPIRVDSYEAAKAFVLSLGLEVKGEQESKREVWCLGKVEIMLDEWPWAPSFIEIEAGSEAEVKDVADHLNLNWPDAKFGGITPVYMDAYKLTREEFESLELSMKFNQPVPGVLKAKSSKPA